MITGNTSHKHESFTTCFILPRLNLTRLLMPQVTLRGVAFPNDSTSFPYICYDCHFAFVVSCTLLTSSVWHWEKTERCFVF